MGDLITLNQKTSLDVPADRVLNAAIGNVEKVVIIGYDNDGAFYFASSMADGGDVLWLLENLKVNLLQIAREKR